MFDVVWAKLIYTLKRKKHKSGAKMIYAIKRKKIIKMKQNKRLRDTLTDKWRRR